MPTDFLEFVRLYIAYCFNSSNDQFEAMRRGFQSVCSLLPPLPPPSELDPTKQILESNAISLFTPEELELLVRGSLEPLNVGHLKIVTRYQGYVGDHDPTIQLFWRYVEHLTQERQRKLLAFICGNDRIPATGLMSLLITAHANTTRLPTSHTCFNQLILPRYRDYEALQRAMDIVISESEGFGLR